VLVLGLTFKENVPDIRNTKVVDIIAVLRDYEVEVLVHDPVASVDEAHHEYGFDLVSLEAVGYVDAVVLAVVHDQFKLLAPAQLKALCANGNGCGVVVDVKNLLERDMVEG
jgi:UDP-N-acetyl-D-galactosamine dehydrogenase